jgi:hypothetical protein
MGGGRRAGGRGQRGQKKPAESHNSRSNVLNKQDTGNNDYTTSKTIRTLEHDQHNEENTAGNPHEHMRTVKSISNSVKVVITANPNAQREGIENDNVSTTASRSDRQSTQSNTSISSTDTMRLQHILQPLSSNGRHLSNRTLHEIQQPLLQNSGSSSASNYFPKSTTPASSSVIGEQQTSTQTTGSNISSSQKYGDFMVEQGKVMTMDKEERMVRKYVRDILFNKVKFITSDSQLVHSGKSSTFVKNSSTGTSSLITYCWLTSNRRKVHCSCCLYGQQYRQN